MIKVIAFYVVEEACKRSINNLSLTEFDIEMWGWSIRNSLTSFEAEIIADIEGV